MVAVTAFGGFAGITVVVLVHAFETEALTKARDVVQGLIIDHVGDGRVVFIHVCHGG